MKGSFLLFTGAILLLSFLGLFEYYRMALPHRRIESGVAVALGGLLPLVFLSQHPAATMAAVTCLMLLSGMLFLFRLRDIRSAAEETGLYLLGFLYVPLLLGHLLLLRAESHGSNWILLLLVIVMSGDSAAFYVGSSFGRNRLYPEVSPKKSREGALGGLVGSIAGAFIFKFFFFNELGTIDTVLCAVVLGIFGQVGDLFESLLKRSFGVKDSGSIFPGHGGILDRLDSILFAAPPLFYYAAFLFRAGG